MTSFHNSQAAPATAARPPTLPNMAPVTAHGEAAEAEEEGRGGYGAVEGAGVTKAEPRDVDKCEGPTGVGIGVEAVKEDNEVAV